MSTLISSPSLFHPKRCSHSGQKVSPQPAFWLPLPLTCSGFLLIIPFLFPWLWVFQQHNIYFTFLKCLTYCESGFYPYKSCKPTIVNHQWLLCWQNQWPLLYPQYPFSKADGHLLPKVLSSLRFCDTALSSFLLPLWSFHPSLLPDPIPSSFTQCLNAVLLPGLGCAL